MPKRTYYDRVLGKDIRDRTIYRRKDKKEKKAKYTSKAFRAFETYLRTKYDLFTLAFTESMHMAANRQGFMRRYLARVEGETLPTVEHTPKYLAYMDEKREYHPKAVYTVPQTVYTWEVLQKFLEVKDSLSDAMKQDMGTLPGSLKFNQFRKPKWVPARESDYDTIEVHPMSISRQVLPIFYSDVDRAGESLEVNAEVTKRLKAIIEAPEFQAKIEDTLKAQVSNVVSMGFEMLDPCTGEVIAPSTNGTVSLATIEFETFSNRLKDDINKAMSVPHDILHPKGT